MEIWYHGLRLIDDTDEKRHLIVADHGKQEGTVQIEIHLVLRRHGCTVQHHLSIGGGGHALLIRNHARTVIEIGNGNRMKVCQRRKVRLFAEAVRNAQRLQPLFQRELRADVEFRKRKVDAQRFLVVPIVQLVGLSCSRSSGVVPSSGNRNQTEPPCCRSFFTAPNFLPQ